MDSGDRINGAEVVATGHEMSDKPSVLGTAIVFKWFVERTWKTIGLKGYFLNDFLR